MANKLRTTYIFTWVQHIFQMYSVTVISNNVFRLIKVPIIMFSNLKQLSLPLYYEYCLFSPRQQVSIAFACAVSIHSPGNNTLISFWVTLLPCILCVFWRWENSIPLAIVIGSGVGMWTNKEIHVSLRILLELLRETALWFGGGWWEGRSLKLLGGYFTITHEKPPTMKTAG